MNASIDCVIACRAHLLTRGNASAGRIDMKTPLSETYPLWTSHKRRSVLASATRVSPALAPKPALRFPQAYAFPCNSRYVPSFAIHQETWFSSPGKRKRACTLLHDGSVFTQGTEFTLEPVSTILLSRYYSSILTQPIKSGKRYYKMYQEAIA
jgi:hypothetical protein